MGGTLHLVFKTHLDVGFTDYGAVVKQKYFDDYFPRALAVARQLRDAGGPERFVWTTGSWILYEYLEQADNRARREAEEGIAAGDLRWHGLPFTTHSELLDPGLFRFGLGLAQELDKRFGTRTIAAKMTDVPGHTRGIVPLLVESGIRFLHIGVNAASRPPNVPPVFRWREPETGAELVVMYNKGGYGGAEEVPGLDHVLGFAHTDDNLGPQTTAEVTRAFDFYRSRFPGLMVTASTLDAFAGHLDGVRPGLPLVEQEIGDTWIHGTASDPFKVAGLRALTRLRARWAAAGLREEDRPDFHRFSRNLLLAAEHSWGMDFKTHLADYRNYTRTDFTRAREIDTVSEPAPPEFSFAERFRRGGAPQSYRKIEASWSEKRAYLRSAVAALGEPRRGAEAGKALNAGRPVPRATGGKSRAVRLEGVHALAHFNVRFSPVNGCIVSLVQKREGTEWAGKGSPLALFRYQSFSTADYRRFLKEFVVNLDDEEVHSWAMPDYGRLGLAPADSSSALWSPRVVKARRDGGRFVFDLLLPRLPRTLYGAPAAVRMTYTFPAREPCVDVELSWSGKPASRLPEAAWLSFVPSAGAAAEWQLHKMGRWISPLHVVSCGNRSLHGIQDGVRVTTGSSRLAIESLDAHLVSPGEPRLLRFDDTQPRLAGGMHFCLHDNVWSTNFPLWYGDDARFRFRLRFASAG